MEGNQNQNNEPNNGAQNEPNGAQGQNNEPEKKYSEDEMNKIVEERLARERAKAKKDAEEAAKKAEAEKADAARRAKMTAEEKAADDLKKLQEENEQLKAAQLHVELSNEATAALKEAELTATTDMLDLVVGADSDSTKENVEKLKGIIDAAIKAHDAERAKGRTPAGTSGNGNAETPFSKHLDKWNS